MQFVEESLRAYIFQGGWFNDAFAAKPHSSTIQVSVEPLVNIHILEQRRLSEVGTVAYLVVLRLTRLGIDDCYFRHADRHLAFA